MMIHIGCFRRFSHFVSAFLALWISGQAHGRTRFHEYTERFYSPPDVATPLTAGYLGGSGNEYIAGAAFFPNGGLVLAGQALGPTFDLMGRDVPVLGTDRTSAESVNLPKNDRGELRHIRSWEMDQGAGFLVLLDPSYQRIHRAVRFPWNSGVLTDVAVDSQGGVYVTGRAGREFAALTPSRKIEVTDFSSNGESFIGRLRPDWSGFEWCFRIEDDRDSTPMLRYLGEGRLSWVGANGLHFNTRGEVTGGRKIGYSSSWVRGVDFRTFDYATGGMRHTRTGWEPWIQPALHMYNADGTYRFRTHEWDPTLAGTNFSRLISDSSAQVIAFDRNGDLLAAGWSDGGNSVWAHVPFDLTRHMQHAIKETTGRDRGLPFSTWGAGIGSFAHLIKLDPATANPLNYTLFISYLWNENRPNSVTMSMMDTAVDNSLVISGRSAWGLIQTGSVVVNTLDADARDYVGGDFIAILNEDWNNIRYSSAVPGAGRVGLKRRSNRMSTNFGAESVQVGNKTRVVFFGGASEDEKFKPVNPIQNGFGGGDLDGIFVVLEMETLPRVRLPSLPYPTSGGRTVNIRESDEGLSGSFIINRGMRNDHSVIVLRDTTGKQWPTFYRGRPVGESTIDGAGRGRFTLIGESNRVQLRGGSINDMRVGGRADQEEFPEINFEFNLDSPDRATALITFNGQTLRKTGNYVRRRSRPTGQGINLSGVFSATRQELGLVPPGSPHANDEILINWWVPARPASGGESPSGGRRRESASEPATPAAPARGRTPPPAAPADRHAMRTWTDTQGRTIEARLVNRDGNFVTIQRADGQVFTLALDRLSETDRNFVQ
jgi:hypothetical protein